MVLVPFTALLYIALGLAAGLLRLALMPFVVVARARSRRRQRRERFEFIDSIAHLLPIDHPLRPENRGRRHRS